VDVDKVAEAILGRSTTRILILPCAAVARRAAEAAEQEPELASDDVLEAA
jgi:hypothetical protein